MNQMPSLPPRERLIEKFSTYIQIKNQRLYWQPESCLIRNFNVYKTRLADKAELNGVENDESAWVKLWTDIILEKQQEIYDWEPENRKRLAFLHLGAYCDNLCYWASIEMVRRYQNHDWENCFCIARTILYKSNNLISWLQLFDIERASLKTYIQKNLTWTLQKQSSISRMSRWRLLYKTPQQEIEAALINHGIQEPQLSYILFARKYFKRVYFIQRVKNQNRGSRQKWPIPEIGDFVKAAAIYNTERIRNTAPYEVFASSSDISEDTLSTWMECVISALNQYSLSVESSFSLDALTENIGFEVISEESNFFETSNLFTDDNTGQDSLKYRLDITLETTLIQELNKNHREILILHYGFDWKQVRIGDYLKLNQSQISRRLTKAKRKLLQSLIQLVKPEEWIDSCVDSWLNFMYRAPDKNRDLLHAVLVNAVRELPNNEMKVCRYYFGHNLNELQISERLNISVIEVLEILQKIRKTLSGKLLRTLDSWIDKLVKKWLILHYQNHISSICGALNISQSFDFSEEKIKLIINEYLDR